MPIDSTDYDNLMQMLDDEDGMASEVSRTWDVWKKARSENEAVYNETKQQVYATSTRTTSNNGKGGITGEGTDHSVHLPKLTQIADNLSAHYKRSLFSSRDWLLIDSHDNDAATKSKQTAVLSYLKVKHDAGNFINIMQAVRRRGAGAGFSGFFLFGTDVPCVSWRRTGY